MKIYTCTYTNCDKSFGTKWALNRHNRTHTGEKPYQCKHSNCIKSFAEYSAMLRHLRTHTTTKSYKCTFEGCTKAFKGKLYLENHLKVHQDATKYKCKHITCHKCFASQQSLARHCRLWHHPVGQTRPNDKQSLLELQLRERIIRISFRHKEKIAKFEAKIQQLTDENKELRARLAQFEVKDSEKDITISSIM